MPEPLRWGILGTGNIARKFASQLPQSERGELVAVGSRSAASAGTFSDEHGGSPGDYEHVLNDPDVQAVYISLPNSLHHAWTIRTLEAGKHVLCEKPIAANTEQAEQMFDVAERTGRVLIEAFMYRCHPAVMRLIEVIREGAIGELKLIRTHFTFCRAADAHDVRYQSALSGGSLMDVGCYCINLARAVAGCEPTGARAIAHRHPHGVDDFAAGTLDFGGNVLAVFTCGMTVQADRTTILGGSDGFIAMDTPWFCDGSFEITNGSSSQTVQVPTSLEPYALEAVTFAQVVQDGEPPWVTRADSVGNMRVLDQLRAEL